MRAYDFHPEAESDLNAIWDYIAAESPDAADRTIDKILAAIEALVPLPHLGHRRPDLTSCPLLCPCPRKSTALSTKRSQ